MKLEKRLREWAEIGLITSDQADRIRRHEDSKPESSWVMAGLLILGAVIVAIGIVSLVAANWAYILDEAKLAGDFAILLGVAYATYLCWEAKKFVLFEVLLIFFMLLCLASIGLISQIYHTGGKLYQALLIWSLITVGAAAAAKRSFAPFIWAGGFLAGIVYTLLDAPVFYGIFKGQESLVFMMVPMLCALMAAGCRVFAKDGASTRALRAWTLMSGLIALVVQEVSFEARWVSLGDPKKFIPAYVLALASGLVIALSPEYRKTQKILLLVTLGLYLILFHLPLMTINFSVVHAFFTISVLGLMAMFMASIHARTVFQGLLLLMGLRFLVLYFQALGGLATTGVGLIVSGLLIIGMTVLWNKYRKPLASSAERWVK